MVLVWYQKLLTKNLAQIPFIINIFDTYYNGLTDVWPCNVFFFWLQRKCKDNRLSIIHDKIILQTQVHSWAEYKLHILQVFN